MTKTPVCERCSKPIPAARAKRSTTCSDKCANALRQARKRGRAGDGSARRDSGATPGPHTSKPVGHTLALAQAQIRFLRTCGAKMQNLLDLLEDEHPLDRPWTPADVQALDSARFTGEELADVDAALEQWKRDCRLI